MGRGAATRRARWFAGAPQDVRADRNKQPSRSRRSRREEGRGAGAAAGGVNPPSVLQGPDQAQNATNLKKPPKKLFDPASWPWWLRALLFYVLGPALALLAVYGAIRGLKALQRRRHATRGTAVARIAWAWNDLMETARSYGHQLPRRATRLEQAQALAGRAHTHALATAANAHVFGPDEPGTEEAYAYWQLASAARSDLRSEAGLAPAPCRPRRAPAPGPKHRPRPPAPHPPPPPTDEKGDHLVKLKFTLRSTGGVDADLVATVDATTTVGQLADAHLYAEVGVPCVPVALNSGLFWPRRAFRRLPGTIVVGVPAADPARARQGRIFQAAPERHRVRRPRG